MFPFSTFVKFFTNNKKYSMQMLLLQLAKKPYVRNPFYDVASCHFLIEIS